MTDWPTKMVKTNVVIEELDSATVTVKTAFYSYMDYASQGPVEEFLKVHLSEHNLSIFLQWESMLFYYHNWRNYAKA